MTHRADPQPLPPPTYLRSLADSISAHLPTRVVGLSASLIGRAVSASVGESGADAKRKDRVYDRIEWAGFDEAVEEDGELHLYLTLGYVNGWQVWDVNETSGVSSSNSSNSSSAMMGGGGGGGGGHRHGNGGSSSSRPSSAEGSSSASSSRAAGPNGGVTMTEVISRRDGPVRCIKAIPYLPEGRGATESGDDLGGRLVALACADAPRVNIYATDRGGYAMSLRLSTEACALEANGRHLAVGFRSSIEIYDAAGAFEHVMTLPCLEHPVPGRCAFSLGPRWLAYAADSAAPSVNPEASALSQAGDIAKGVASSVASGLATLGGIGHQTVVSYWTGQPPPPVRVMAPRAEEPAHAGCVAVRDLVSRKVVAHFQAHAHRVAAISFDASGTILATASADGHNVHVYQLAPPGGIGGIGGIGGVGAGAVVATQPHLAYKFHRGNTDADLSDLRFSHDSLWLSASTAFGITHVFAMDPGGGPVSARTHLASHRDSHAVVPRHLLDSLSEPRPAVYAGAVVRVRQSPAVDPKCVAPVPAGAAAGAELPPVSAFFLGEHAAGEAGSGQGGSASQAVSYRRLLTITHGRGGARGGVLTLHTLATRHTGGEWNLGTGSSQGLLDNGSSSSASHGNGHQSSVSSSAAGLVSGLINSAISSTVGNGNANGNGAQGSGANGGTSSVVGGFGGALGSADAVAVTATSDIAWDVARGADWSEVNGTPLRSGAGVRRPSEASDSAASHGGNGNGNGNSSVRSAHGVGASTLDAFTFPPSHGHPLWASNPISAHVYTAPAVEFVTLSGGGGGGGDSNTNRSSDSNRNQNGHHVMYETLPVAAVEDRPLPPARKDDTIAEARVFAAPGDLAAAMGSSIGERGAGPGQSPVARVTAASTAVPPASTTPPPPRHTGVPSGSRAAPVEQQQQQPKQKQKQKQKQNKQPQQQPPQHQPDSDDDDDDDDDDQGIDNGNHNGKPNGETDVSNDAHDPDKDKDQDQDDVEDEGEGEDVDEEDDTGTRTGTEDLHLEIELPGGGPGHRRLAPHEPASRMSSGAPSPVAGGQREPSAEGLPFPPGTFAGNDPATTGGAPGVAGNGPATTEPEGGGGVDLAGKEPDVGLSDGGVPGGSSSAATSDVSGNTGGWETASNKKKKKKKKK